MIAIFHLCVPSSTINCAINDETEKGVTAVLGLLEKIAQIAKDIPPVDNAASRFGNPAFRTFYDKVTEVRRISLNSMYMCIHQSLDIAVFACVTTQSPFGKCIGDFCLSQ